MCNALSEVVPTNEISRIDQCHMTCDVLFSRVLFPRVIEMVIVLGVMYMVSYGSILVIWCLMGLYVLMIGGLGMVLMRIVFYGGLMVVTILIVIPNGNAHYYYSGRLMLYSVVVSVRSIYIGVLSLAIIMLVLIL